VKSVCGFCSTGCSLTVRDGRLAPTIDYPVNLGTACPKGWEALTPLASADRATRPLLRGEPTDWDTALRTFVSRFKSIQARHGAASVAFLSTGQIVTEEMAFLGALTKLGMGLIHGDGNTRQCMATSVAAYKESFGFDAPPYSYADLEQSDVIVLIGSNLCIAHPILWERLCRNRRNPKVIVVDPRKTETAMAATHHYALRPKSDLSLLYGLANLLVLERRIDRRYIDAHTTGFPAFAEHVAAFTPERVCESTGLSPDELRGFAEMVGRGERVSFWWTMGVNQSHEGTRVAQAIVNLALMTGNLGRPGTGANSITGQCNAMGSRLFSNTTNLFGGRDFKNAEHRAEVAEALRIPVERIPDRPSLAYDQIVEGIAKGEIHGLWIIATNPAHSWINQRDLHQLLDRLDFLVVQDMYADTETARRAHLFLPAAAWGEKDGTFINSERRIGRTRKVSRAPGQALADFHIFRAIAEYWGCADLFREWTSPEAVFQILKRLSAGRPCDITGITDWDMLDTHGGIQWPLPAGQTVESAERRLFEDGGFFTPDGRARFCFEAPRAVPEPPSADYPFVLLTGRGSSAEWHTRTRTKRSPVLRRLSPRELHVEVNPADARKLGIAPHSWVLVGSRRAEIRARAFVTHGIAPGQVFLPMHFPEVNQLTLPVVDPYSRQPAYKHCAVSLRPDR
jgi:assimilatory nitrate reductase catalytic subunit